MRYVLGAVVASALRLEATPTAPEANAAPTSAPAATPAYAAPTSAPAVLPTGDAAAPTAWWSDAREESAYGPTTAPSTAGRPSPAPSAAETAAPSTAPLAGLWDDDVLADSRIVGSTPSPVSAVVRARARSAKKAEDDDALDAAGGEVLVVCVFALCAAALLSLLVVAFFKDRERAAAAEHRRASLDAARAFAALPDHEDPALCHALALSLVTADAEGVAFALEESGRGARPADDGAIVARDSRGAEEEKIEMADL